MPKRILKHLSKSRFLFLPQNTEENRRLDTIVNHALSSLESWFHLRYKRQVYWKQSWWHDDVFVKENEMVEGLPSLSFFFVLPIVFLSWEETMAWLRDRLLLDVCHQRVSHHNDNHSAVALPFLPFLFSCKTSTHEEENNRAEQKGKAWLTLI